MMKTPLSQIFVCPFEANSSDVLDKSRTVVRVSEHHGIAWQFDRTHTMYRYDYMHVSKVQGLVSIGQRRKEAAALKSSQKSLEITHIGDLMDHEAISFDAIYDLWCDASARINKELKRAS